MTETRPLLEVIMGSTLKIPESLQKTIKRGRPWTGTLTSRLYGEWRQKSRKVCDHDPHTHGKKLIMSLVKEPLGGLSVLQPTYQVRK